MCSLPSLQLTASSIQYFFKDGRKICVGDCALFKCPQKFAPLIGIISCVTSVGESNLTLSVNRLYRSSEVKLVVAPEAAPNEVFYSFHSDKISAASLLHPCKVAFLPKDIELPFGISSFVCRRVYDIAHKCLWWLTDHNYADDRQEELDQLLHKTNIEMRATGQRQGIRSPKPYSAASAALKHSPDSIQISSSYLSCQTKGKKRERGDQFSEPIKRERSVRIDGRDTEQSTSESVLKLEVAKITEKGGLVDSETVEKLVQLMQPVKPERKIDLTGRCILVGVIAATDKIECLGQFVQFRGLSVLDEWLQEVHKGKICDSGNIKDNGKPVEEFILVLLRALDKLPVNLNALQMCNIGKSVNHLRSHKNIEIQKKARNLVDTWKKRVKAEINIDDAKSGSSQTVTWPGRSRHDSSHSESRHSSGSSEAAIKSSVTRHSSMKSTSVKLNLGDSTSKSTSGCQGRVRPALSPTSTAANYKGRQSRISVNAADVELPRALVEEKCSSSSQSRTDNHCSGDHAKNMKSSGREGTRSSTARSRSSKKMTGSGSKLRKLSDDLQGTPAYGVQRDAVPNRDASVAQMPVVEKVADDVNAIDSSVHEANNHKLIVKIPNQCRSAAQNIAAGTTEDSFCRSSRVSSPVLSEKGEQSSARLKGNHVRCQYNEVDGSSTSVHCRTSHKNKRKHDPCQSNKVDGSSTSVHCRTSHENKSIPTFSKVSSSPARNEMRLKEAPDSSLNSMNALVESCVKFSEANTAMSAGDDVGMNLLARVAAGEIPKSATVSPSVSPHKTSAAGGCGNCNRSKKQLNGEGLIQQQCQSSNFNDADKCDIIVGVLKVGDADTSGTGTRSNIPHQNEEGNLKSNGKLNEHVGVSAPGGTEMFNGESATVQEDIQNHIVIANQGFVGPSAAYEEVKDAFLNEESEKRVLSDTTSYPSFNVDDDQNNHIQRQHSIIMDQHSVTVALQSESKSPSQKIAVVLSNTGKELATKNSDAVKPGKPGGTDLSDHSGSGNNIRIDQENEPSPMLRKQEDSGLPSSHKEQNTTCKDENVENMALVHHSESAAVQVNLSTGGQQESEVHFGSKHSNFTDTDEERKGNGALAAEIGSQSHGAGGLDIDTRLGFDLNEGFDMDNANGGETVSSASDGILASITVDAADKGSFGPSDDLLKNKTKLGWEGYATTSTFCPAEPSKVAEVPLDPSKFSLPDAPVCKQMRPPLDIDLNVADESVLDFGCQASGQEFNNRSYPSFHLMTSDSSRCPWGIGLDLNKADEVLDLDLHSGGKDQRLEVSSPPSRALPSSIFSSGGEANGTRDFDLNNGPAAEEMPVEQISYNQQRHNNIAQTPFGPKINGSNVGNCFTWYPQGTIYSVSMTPSALPDRETFPIARMGSGTQRVVDSPASNMSFGHDAYKASMFPSTPVMPFHSSQFHPVYPSVTSFPVPTSALPFGSGRFMDPAAGRPISALPSQLIGSAATVPFQYPHAYVVSRPINDAGNNGVVESHQKLGKQGLDLNFGPGSVRGEGRGESLPTVSKNYFATSSQPLAEEQARMSNMAGGVLRRNEPEGGWTMDKINFKQSSWR